ncbi:MAG: hypothetical protein QOJ38_1839 [Solirubrobacterales bacterium]|nr:hypothetical protein [Solirubrobacterales bacterium]
MQLSEDGSALSVVDTGGKLSPYGFDSSVEVIVTTQRPQSALITDAGPWFQIVDTSHRSSGPTAGPGCWEEQDRNWGDVVYCPRVGVQDVDVEMGDGNDKVEGEVEQEYRGGPRVDKDLPPFSARLSGGDGSDWVADLPGPTVIDGGPGEDWGSFQQLSDMRWDFPEPGINVTLDGQANDGTAAEPDNNVVAVESFVTTKGPDTLVGNDAVNWFTTAQQDDVLKGGGGDDILHGHGGRFDGGDGNDIIATTFNPQDPDEAAMGPADVVCGPGYDWVRYNTIDSIAKDCESGYNQDTGLSFYRQNDPEPPADDPEPPADVTVPEQIDEIPELDIGSVTGLTARRPYGRVGLRCSNPPSPECTGGIVIVASGQRVSAEHGVPREASLGGASFEIEQDNLTAVPVKLTRKARQLLVRKKKVSAVLRAELVDGDGQPTVVTKAITLKRR